MEDDKIKAPVPFMHGKFSLYETPEGGYHVAYKEDGDNTETKHIEIPAFMVNMAKKASEGGGLPSLFGKAKV